MPSERFQNDFDWQRRYIPHMKRIIGEHLIVEAPFEEDEQRNTDLIVFGLSAVRVACRVRRSKYASRYQDEFTVRLSRPSLAPTELSKIISGWGDYMLYGFAGPDDLMSAWILGDLSVFRLWFARKQFDHPGRLPGVEKRNGDGSSTFLAFDVGSLPDQFVVAREMIREAV